MSVDVPLNVESIAKAAMVDNRPAIGDSTAPYRTPDKRLAVAAARLTEDRDCWFITANRERGPHAVPLSFLALGPRVILATAPGRRAARDVELDPRVVLVLGGYGDAIRLLGGAEVVSFRLLDVDARTRYVAKMKWDPARGDFAGLVVTLDQIQCSRSQAEDQDRIIWRAGTRTTW